jgi:hypothetical protein
MVEKEEVSRREVKMFSIATNVAKHVPRVHRYQLSMATYWRIAAIFLGALLLREANGAPIELLISKEFGHHVTIEEQADSYLIRADVGVDLNSASWEAGEMHLEVKLISDKGDEVTRQVSLENAKEVWNFYFKTPNQEESATRYGLIAKVDKAPAVVLAVWEMRGNTISLGSQESPLTMQFRENIPITQEISPGQFEVKAVRETRTIRSDYKSLPIVQMSSADKRLPRDIKGEVRAIRLMPD